MKAQRIRMRLVGRIAAVSLVLAGSPLSAADTDALRDEIALHLEQLRAGAGLVVGESTVASSAVLPEFYEQRAFRPAWTDPAIRAEMIRAVAASYDDGLSPEDYHLSDIERLHQRVEAGGGDLAVRADLDILLTDALIRLKYHLRHGKVDPVSLDSNWNFSGPVGGKDPVEALEEAIGSGRLVEVIDSYKPSSFYYTELEKELARYRELAAAGGWEPVPEIDRLDPGDDDERVPALRRRMAAEGHLSSSASMTSTVYDDELAEAVRRFQLLHGLNQDGVVGPNTLAAMNVSAEERVDQIRLNLERGRWILHGLEDDYIAVNIASFYMYVIKDGKPYFLSPVVVGREHHESPVFKGELQYLVLNPTWTVPPGIARGEILPKLRDDRGYLAAKNMEMLDRAGNVVDETTADLSAAGGFPYVFRQKPGPTNALGRVKFIFPNEHFVFLHDTPSRDLFSREVRTFSHGCIRVGEPIALAEALLADEEDWDRARIDSVLESGETTTVYFEERLPVLILYWTAWVNPDRELKFYNDVYGRDAAVLEALDREFEPTT